MTAGMARTPRGRGLERHELVRHPFDIDASQLRNPARRGRCNPLTHKQMRQAVTRRAHS